MTDPQGLATRHWGYDAQGDLTASSMAAITTTLTGITSTATPVTTTYGYDLDGDQTRVTAANGAATTSAYDHLGRQTRTTRPAVTLASAPVPVGATGLGGGAAGTIATAAGTGSVGYSGDGGPPAQAQFHGVAGVAVDAAGNLYIADALNNRVREVRAGSGTIITVAGTGNVGYSGDGGPATAAQLATPEGVAVDGAGNLYIADSGNHAVREVYASTGVIVTAAGAGTAGYSGDGGPAASAPLRAPVGVAMDGAGTLYIADSGNHAVRAVAAASGVITTLAGGTGCGATCGGDGGPATSAQLNYPRSMAADGAGALLIADDFGQKVRVVFGVAGTSAPVETTTYDGEGHVAATTDAAGATTTSSYDPLGRQVSTTDPVAGTSTTSYNATERVSSTDADGHVSQLRYDGAGRLVQASDPLTGTVQYQYDAVGNTVAITSGDSSGAILGTETRGYDARNRVQSDTVGGPGVPALVTTTWYDADGNVVQVVAPAGDAALTTYDLAGETLTTEDDPRVDAGPLPALQTSYGYDGAGNQATRQDPDGRTTSTVYDGDNRVTQSVAVTGTSTVATTLGYDPDGNTVAETTQTTDSAHPGQPQVSTYSATYDAADRVATETDNGLTTVYGYDAQGQQRVATVQDGQTAIATALDAEGRVTSIVEGDPYTSNFSYNANDQLQTVSLPGGVQQSMQYDPNSQLVGVTAQGPTTGGTFTSLTSQYQYTYDAASRVNSTTTLSGTDALAYDGPGRLTSETEQAGSTQVIAHGGAYGWTYDGNGNLQTAIDDTGATDVYTYSTTIRDELTLMGATGNPVTETNAYSYDGRGDVTSIANTAPSSDKNALVQHLSYDSQGRVTQVTYLDHSNGNTTTTITIAYNADGQRSDYTYTPQGQPPLDTQFQYRDGQLAEQRVVSDTATGPVVIYTNTYLYGPTGEPLELLHAQPGQTVARYWYILDGQGSVVALTDANGSVVDRYAYDSWGESTSDDRTNEHVPQQLRYKAQYYDEKLTWYWLGGRYYDPETERFLQPEGDPSFVYANDSPANPGAACKIEVRFKPAVDFTIPVAHARVVKYHAYIITQGAVTRYYRGGPQNHTLSDSSGNSSDNSGKGAVPLGFVRTAHGLYRVGTQDYSTEPRPFFTVHDPQNRTCDCLDTMFVQTLTAIDRANTVYTLFTANSNSVVYTVLSHANLNPPDQTPSTAPSPGWQISLPPYPNFLYYLLNGPPLPFS